jgi:hypothetical protein
VEEVSVAVGGEVKEGGCQNNAEDKRTRESHGMSLPWSVKPKSLLTEF